MHTLTMHANTLSPRKHEYAHKHDHDKSRTLYNLTSQLIPDYSKNTASYICTTFNTRSTVIAAELCYQSRTDQSVTLT